MQIKYLTCFLDAYRRNYCVMRSPFWFRGLEKWRGTEGNDPRIVIEASKDEFIVGIGWAF